MESQILAVLCRQTHPSYCLSSKHPDCLEPPAGGMGGLDESGRGYDTSEPFNSISVPLTLSVGRGQGTQTWKLVVGLGVGISSQIPGPTSLLCPVPQRLCLQTPRRPEPLPAEASCSRGTSQPSLARPAASAGSSLPHSGLSHAAQASRPSLPQVLQLGNLNLDSNHFPLRRR